MKLKPWEYGKRLKQRWIQEQRQTYSLMVKAGISAQWTYCLRILRRWTAVCEDRQSNRQGESS